MHTDNSDILAKLINTRLLQVKNEPARRMLQSYTSTLIS